MNDDYFEQQRRRLDAEIAEDLRRIDSVMKVVCYAAAPMILAFTALLLALAYRTIVQ
jgi:hypothetical protein